MRELQITYRLGGAVKTTASSNADLEIIDKTEGNRREVTVRALTDINLLSACEDVFEADKEDAFFLNGYQSWTDTKEFFLWEKERDASKLPRFLNEKFAFDKYGDPLFYNYEKGKLHGYDLFYTRGNKEIFFLNDNFRFAYLLFEVNRKTGVVTLRSDFDEFPLERGHGCAVFAYYTEKDRQAGLRLLDELYPVKPREKIFGYTSWYNYYQDVNEEILLRDLSALGDEFDLFQIDDGYETFVGDWLDVSAEKFPNGLKGIVEKAHASGKKAGVWLAPFVAEEKSRTFREHPEWFKRDGHGAPVKCGGNWSGFYALDMQNPAAKAYVKKCLAYFVDLGFDFFKLDFLYAVSFQPDAGKTRSMTAEEAYAFLREELGDKIILGCGATLFNSIGKFDYLRIGPDVSLIFDDVWFMRRMHRERISTKNTLQNTVYRSFLNGRFFGNDPDVFLLRDDNLSLTEKQRKALVTLNALFGNVMMTSDNVAAYDEKKRAMLSEALDLYRNASVHDYRRSGRYIEIEFSLHGERRKLVYDTNKGELTENAR